MVLHSYRKTSTHTHHYFSMIPPGLQAVQFRPTGGHSTHYDFTTLEKLGGTPYIVQLQEIWDGDNGHLSFKRILLDCNV
jgi:hypothetical protein